MARALDATPALYEWNYQRQLLHIKLDENSQCSLAEREADIFSEDFLLKRPLLQAITRRQPPVLLIDELDRADEPPHVVLTSNRTRELSDAVRRRCFYLWIDYPRSTKKSLSSATRSKASTSNWPSRSAALWN